MPIPLDSRVLTLLSVVDDAAEPGSHRHSLTPSCEGRRYVHHARAGDLEVMVWTLAGTAWVSRRGLLSRRAAHPLSTLLTGSDASAVVLDTAELQLPSASGGTPLVTLCATLSVAGYSVAVVGHDDDALVDEPASRGARPDLRVVTTARAGTSGEVHAGVLTAP